MKQDIWLAVTFYRQFLHEYNCSMYDIIQSKLLKFYQLLKGLYINNIYKYICFKTEKMSMLKICYTFMK